MILEDDIAVLESMAGILTRWGCQIIPVSTADEAFDKINKQQKKPELLIADYR